MLEKQTRINIYYSNAFVNNIFQYYYDFKNRINCYDSTKILINEFIKNEVNNIKPIDCQEHPTFIKKHTSSTVDNDKLNRIREQKRNYYLRNKNKYREYQKKNNDSIKQYQKNYRNKNKLKLV